MPLNAGLIITGFLNGALVLRVAGYRFSPSRSHRFPDRVLGALADGFPIPLAIGSLFAVAQLTTVGGKASAFPLTAGIVMLVGAVFSALYYAHSKQRSQEWNRFEEPANY